MFQVCDKYAFGFPVGFVGNMDKGKNYFLLCNRLHKILFAKP